METQENSSCVNYVLRLIRMLDKVSCFTSPLPQVLNDLIQYYFPEWDE